MRRGVQPNYRLKFNGNENGNEVLIGGGTTTGDDELPIPMPFVNSSTLPCLTISGLTYCFFDSIWLFMTDLSCRRFLDRLIEKMGRSPA